MYTAVVLTPISQQTLINAFRSIIPAEWSVICHHMTVNMGSLNDGPAAGNFQTGQTFKLNVKSIAQDDKVMAVGVDCDVPSSNKIKHITLAVNRTGGGKPFHSNNLFTWQPTSPIQLDGILEEVQ